MALGGALVAKRLRWPNNLGMRLAAPRAFELENHLSRHDLVYVVSQATVTLRTPHLDLGHYGHDTHVAVVRLRARPACSARSGSVGHNDHAEAVRSSPQRPLAPPGPYDAPTELVSFNHLRSATARWRDGRDRIARLPAGCQGAHYKPICKLS
jgi:hypothetical protein